MAAKENSNAKVQSNENVDNNSVDSENPLKRPWLSPTPTGVSPPLTKSRASLPVEEFLDLLCDSRVLPILEKVVSRAVQAQIEPLTTKVTELESRVCASEAAVTSQSTLLTQAMDKNTSLEAQLKDLRVSHDKVKTDLYNLQVALDDLEQYGRRMSLRFSGIKPSPNGTGPEDTDKILLQLCNGQMGLQLQLSDLQRSHRVGPIESGNRGIIVRFVSYRVRAQVLKARSKLKGTGIYVNEDLTKRRNNLAFLARQLKKQNKVVDTWTYDGKIFVKHRLTADNPALKTSEIRHESDLSKFTVSS